METIILRKPKYEWENKLPFDLRSLAVCKYLEGYAVKPISEWLEVSNTTIEYHLMKAGVYVKRREPTMFIKVNPLPPRTAPQIQRILTDLKVEHKDTNEYYFDEYGEKYRRPKSYAQILRAQQNLARIKKAQQQPKEEVKRTGFLVKMSLTTGNAITRRQDGIYEFSQSSDNPPKYYTSSSTFSY